VHVKIAFCPDVFEDASAPVSNHKFRNTIFRKRSDDHSFCFEIAHLSREDTLELQSVSEGEENGPAFCENFVVSERRHPRARRRPARLTPARPRALSLVGGEGA
jgi:hypothetical protein